MWDEIRGVWPAVAGISNEGLASRGPQWPCLDERNPGTAVLHATAFGRSTRATLERIDYRASAQHIDADFPFLLTTGRTLHQFNVGTMTARTPQIALRPTDTLDMHPYDARQLELHDGVPVRIQSRHGEAVLPLRVTDAVEPG